MLSKKQKIFFGWLVFLIVAFFSYWFFFGSKSLFVSNFNNTLKTELLNTADRSAYKSITQFSHTRISSGYSVPTGFKDSFSPTNFTSGEETHLRRSIWSCESNGIAAVNGISCSYPDSQLAKIKIFFPPGKKRSSVNFTIKGSQGNNGETIVAVGRFGRPPEKDYSGTEILNQHNPSYEPAGLNDLTQSDQFFKKSGGYLGIFSDWLPENFAGGWLYVQMFEMGDQFYAADYRQTVDNDDYRSWYEKQTWQANGDPADPYVDKAALSGDIEPVGNPDGDVDIFDYNIFIQNWGKSATDNPADIDKSGKVDIFDYNLLLGNFGT